MSNTTATMWQDIPLRTASAKEAHERFLKTFPDPTPASIEHHKRRLRELNLRTDLQTVLHLFVSRYEIDVLSEEGLKALSAGSLITLMRHEMGMKAADYAKYLLGEEH